MVKEREGNQGADGDPDTRGEWDFKSEGVEQEDFQ